MSILKGSISLPQPISCYKRANTVADTSTGSKDKANSADDVDNTSFPLQRYLGLLAKMETNAIEMLFAPNRVPANAVWDTIFANRHRILHANKDGFIGFGKSQALRYAVRGQRLETLTLVTGFLESCVNNKRPVQEYFIEPLSEIPGVSWTYGKDSIKQLTVFGRSVPVTVTVAEALQVFQKPILDAGKRAKTAHEHGGADWKGLYHAHRIVDEGLELFATGDLTFPCQNASQYLAIRAGELSLDEVLDLFDEKLADLEALTPTSALATRPDMQFIDDFVAETHGKVVLNYMHR